MSTAFRARLERAFETLREQNITPVLSMAGSAGVSDWDTISYRQIAENAGTPGAFVGASPGSQENGGVYWDVDNRLRYRWDGSTVGILYFWYPDIQCAERLTAALAGAGISAEWNGNPLNSVAIDLTAAPVRPHNEAPVTLR